MSEDHTNPELEEEINTIEPTSSTSQESETGVASTQSIQEEPKANGKPNKEETSDDKIITDKDYNSIPIESGEENEGEF